jgi:hypothetical protein
VHFPLLFQHGELGWHLAVWHQGDTANRNANRVACSEYTADRFNIKFKGYSMLRQAARLFLSEYTADRLNIKVKGYTMLRAAARLFLREYTADRLNIKVKGYSMLRPAARLFLRKVSTLPKFVCVARPGKNLRHVNTESRIK